MFIALGAGIILGAVLMNLSLAFSMNRSIEEKARNLGMVYPEEVRVQMEGEKK